MRRSKFGAALAALAGFPGRCVIFPIKLYRRFISPLKGTPTCRFTPTCSEYAIEAIKEWGAVVGLALAAWRVLRCNPFGGCGHDPVPKRRRRVTKDTHGTSDDLSDM